MADTIFRAFVLYGLVFGMRRGFYKELIAFGSLVLGVIAARTVHDAADKFLAEWLSMPHGIAHVLGLGGVWLVTFFILNVVGRIVLKRLRDPDRENRVAGAAEKVADSVEGDTKAGPVTYLTNPVASAHRSVIYWSDKILGGLLGIAKGIVGAYALFGLVYFAELHTGVDPAGFRASIASSQAKAIYSDYLAAPLRGFREYRLFENVALIEELVEASRGDPATIDRLASHEAWGPVRATAAFQALALDPAIHAAWTKTDASGKRDVHTLLHSAHVRALLSDEEFEEALARTDVEGVVRSLAKTGRPGER